MATLTYKEKLALKKLFANTLNDPQTFVDFLDNPDKALTDLGLKEKNKKDVMDFLGQFRQKLKDVLDAPTDWWPLYPYP